MSPLGSQFKCTWTSTDLTGQSSHQVLIWFISIYLKYILEIKWTNTDLTIEKVQIKRQKYVQKTHKILRWENLDQNVTNLKSTLHMKTKQIFGSCPENKTETLLYSIQCMNQVLSDRLRLYFRKYICFKAVFKS